jgi:hypothetical protein
VFQHFSREPDPTSLDVLPALAALRAAADTLRAAGRALVFSSQVGACLGDLGLLDYTSEPDANTDVSRGSGAHTTLDPRQRNGRNRHMDTRREHTCKHVGVASLIYLLFLILQTRVVYLGGSN